MKKRHSTKWIKWAVLAAVVVVIGIFAWPTLQSKLAGGTSSGRGNNAAQTGAMGSAGTGSAAGSYTSVTRGNLSVTVYGSGSLSPAATQSVYSGAEGKIESIEAQAGDTVRSGDTILRLSSDDLEDSIASLESELFAAQVALSEIRDSGTDYYIYAPSAGRVKLIEAEEDDDIAMLMKLHGSLCVISRDGKMKVEFEPASLEGLAVGDAVSVWIDNQAVAGVIDQIEGLKGNIAVTIDDDSYDVGAEALVTTPQGERLGSGALEINMPIPVTGIGGTVSNVYYEDNDKVASGAKLFYITGRIPSAELQQALLTYQEARIALYNAKK